MARPQNNGISHQRIIQELSATLYSIGDGVLSTDEKGCIRRMNPVAEKLTGWKQEEALGRPVDEVFCIINEYSRSKLKNPVDLVLAEGRMVSLAHHTLLVARDGRETPIADSGAPIIDENGRIMGAVLVFRDQTKEREARKALFEAQRKMATLVSNLPGMAYRCALDKDWTMEFVSQGALELTGYEPQDLAQNNRISYGQIIHPQDRQLVWDAVAQAVSRAAPFTLTYRIVDAAGEEKFVWERGRAVLNADGKVEALEGFISDISLRAKTQRDLAESEEELAAIYKYAPFILMVVDADRRVLKVNDFAEEFSGRTAEEMLGMYGGQALRCVWADDDPAGCGFGPKCPSCVLRQTVLTTLETGKVHQQVETELPFLVKGQRQDLTLLVSTAKIHVRQQPRVLVGIMDITAAKKAGQALEQSEAKYRLIAENAHDVICLQDMDLNFTYISPSAERLRGYTAEEAINQTLEQVLTPASLDLVQKTFAEEMEQETFKQIEGSRTRTLELEEYKKDGSTVWVELRASLLLDEDKNPTGVLSVTRDITGRKRVQQALEESEYKHRLLADNTLDVIWTMDMETRFTYVNQAIRQSFGFEPQEWVGSLLSDHCDAQEMAMMSSIIAHELEHGAPDRGVCFETVMLRKDNSPIDVEILASFILDEKGRPIGIQGTTRDITERKRAAREKEALQAQLANA
ncbi:MAG: PAS domain S-box protein, partial [Desulfatibacillaceae bacterium]|nr:PAS domain S-box protein [Desulfatibacillaceae bacterium]